MKPHSSTAAGLALVITLVFVVLITILIVGMTVSMRTDRMAASSHLERARAKLLAESAVDQVTATLNKHIVEVRYKKWDDQAWDETKQTFGKEIVTERNWITQPGELYVGASADDPATSSIDERRVLQSDPIPLHSGPARTNPDPDTVYDSPNLNIATLYDPDTHLISDGDSTVPGSAAPQMRLAWIYVRRNGKLDTNVVPAKDPDNPIVGRYAYWTDDESSKINYNIAWGRGSDNKNVSLGSPTRIDLAALPDVDNSVSNALRSYLTGGTLMSPPVHLFNSPEDARHVGATGDAVDEKLRDILIRNKFELTHFNHDPGTTFFGDDRWILTTNRNLVPHVVEKDASGNPVLDANGKPKIKYLRKFFDILRDDLPPDSDEFDPGNMFHIETNVYDFSCGYKDGTQTPTAVNPATGKQRNYGPPAIWTSTTRRCKLDIVLRDLVAHLSRTDWPISAGSSFQEKYFPGITKYDPKFSETSSKHSQLTQIALNIISYVCAKESMAKQSGKVYSGESSPRAWPYPTAAGEVDVLGKDRTDNAENPWGLTSPLACWYSGDSTFPAQYIFYAYERIISPSRFNPAFEGLNRMPLITEMGACMEKNPTILEAVEVPPGEVNPATGLVRAGYNTKYKVYLQIELYLPDKYGFKDGINLVPDLGSNPPSGSLGWFVYFAEAKRSTNIYFTNNPAVPSGSPNADMLYYAAPDGILRRGVRPLSVMREYPAQFRLFKDDVIGDDGTWLKPGKRVTVRKIFYRNTPPTQRQYIAMQTGLAVTHSVDIVSNGVMGPGVVTDGLAQISLPVNTTGSGQSSIHCAYQFTRPQRSPFYYKINLLDPLGAAFPGLDVIRKVEEMHSIEVDDPRAGLGVANWKRNSAGNTFGSVNSNSTLHNSPPATSYPQPDTDQNNLISDASLYMPPPAGQKITYSDGSVDDNTLGRVTSIAELGTIPTGIDPLAGCVRADGTTTLIAGVTDKNYNVPWRTLRLQPNNETTTTKLPDWAFMDLFEVPQININERVRNMPGDRLETTDSISDPSSPWYTPYGSSLRGKLNINTHPEPFDSSRKGGLRALLVGARPTAAGAPLSLAQAAGLAENIYGRDFGTKGKKYGHQKVFDTPGEICEVKGIADAGEESEALIREIGSLTASRGEVFTVYTIGQALKETPDGKLKVTAEQRQHAIVERYRDWNGTVSDLTDDVIKLRTVYCRNLYP